MKVVLPRQCRWQIPWALSQPPPWTPLKLRRACFTARRRLKPPGFSRMVLACSLVWRGLLPLLLWHLSCPPPSMPLRAGLNSVAGVNPRFRCGQLSPPAPREGGEHSGLVAPAVSSQARCAISSRPCTAICLPRLLWRERAIWLAPLKWGGWLCVDRLCFAPGPHICLHCPLSCQARCALSPWPCSALRRAGDAGEDGGCGHAVGALCPQDLRLEL